ncbi:MAG: hypothetical protein AAB317_04315 [Nitrospirota bacterium]
MRDLKNFSLGEWFLLRPLVGFLKQVRNDIKQHYFLKKHPSALAPFLSKMKRLKNKNIVLIVAFNSSWVIDKLLYMITHYITDVTFIICDNSNKKEARIEIEKICKEHHVAYFPLPKNPEKHPCRSHGIALNWIFFNIIKNIEPKIFAFIDHDLMPFRKIKLEEELANQPFYGHFCRSDWGWNLWAGYSMFDYSLLKNLKVNFNNDRPNGLDTGGRNWKYLYKHYDKSKLHFAKVEKRTLLSHPNNPGEIQVSVLDDKWLHLSGVTSNIEMFTPKIGFYDDLFREIKGGKEFSDFLTMGR